MPSSTEPTACTFFCPPPQPFLRPSLTFENTPPYSMLSGETAKGDYPIEAVKMMAETCFLAESSICYAPLFADLRNITPRPTETAETLAVSLLPLACVVRR